MKTKIYLLALSSVAMAISASAQSFIGNPAPRMGQTNVMAYWSFNALNIPVASAPGSGGVPISIPADFGTAAVSLSDWTGLVDDFAGSTLNAQNSDVAGASLSLTSNAGNASYIEVSFSMANLSGLVVNFDTRGTSTAFNVGQWSYSTDGTAFTSFGASTASRSTTFATVSPSIAISFLDNDPTVFLRYTLDGATTTGADNRIDNLTLTATVIPEPSSYAAIFGGLALAGVMARRRRA